MNINAHSGHSLHLAKATEEDFTALDLEHFANGDYTSFYVAHNWDAKGVVFFHLAKHENGQIHVWYRSTKRMWTSYGKTFQAAVDGAQRDGWLYA